MRGLGLLALLPCAAALSVNETAAQARPVSKVVGLLQGMKEQLESEAEEEADLMEKYNCWCKENGEQKEKAILEARANIKEWETRITELTGISSTLATEYKNLQQEVDKNELSLDESMALRKKQVAKFQEDEREMFNNLNSVRSAQVALNTSSFPSFLQRPADTPIRLLRAVAERQADYLKSESRQQLMAFLQDPTSGSVRGVIDGLETDFEGSLKELQDEELQNKAAYEKLVSAKRKEIDSAKVQIATKKEEKTAADEERLQKKQAVKDAKGSVEEDLAFAKKVQKQCTAKGQEWEKRQKIRSDEMQAVSKAVEILDSDDSFDLFGKTMAPSFLQLASKKASAMPQQIYDRLLALGKAHDSRLVTLSLQAKVDGLAKVPRSMRRGERQPLLMNGCEQLKEHEDGARCKVLVLETEARSKRLPSMYAAEVGSQNSIGRSVDCSNMAKRSANLLVAAVVACAVYVLLPVESFVAPQSLRGSTPQAEAGAFAQAPTFQTEGRSVQVSMAATGGEPTRFPLVFLGLLAGTAAVGLLAVFFYGSYSGAGSGL